MATTYSDRARGETTKVRAMSTARPIRTPTKMKNPPTAEIFWLCEVCRRREREIENQRVCFQ